MHHIELAGMGKRALAAVVDLIIFLALWVGLFALCETLYTSNDYTRGLIKDLNDYQVSSGLYYLDKDGNAASYEYANYDSYQDVVVHYYTDYLVNSCPESYRQKDYTIYWYNVHILGLADVRGSYSDLGSLEEPSKSKGSTLFAYDGTAYDALGVPQASLYENGVLTETSKAKLLAFYYSSNSQSVYYNAGRNLYHSGFYQKIYVLYEGQEKTYPLITSIPIGSLLYYVVIPLCFSNGETLGKKTFKIALVNRLGFQVKKGQLVLRQLPSPLFAELAFVLLNPAPALTVVSGLLFVSYLFVIFDKDHRALHDFWAGTLAVDAEKSLFYRDAKDQELGEEEYAKAMAEAQGLSEAGEKKVIAEKEIR
jgi:uncharacterized RDD family membrane protein YckC